MLLFQHIVTLTSSGLLTTNLFRGVFLTVHTFYQMHVISNKQTNTCRKHGRSWKTIKCILKHSSTLTKPSGARRVFVSSCLVLQLDLDLSCRLLIRPSTGTSLTISLITVEPVDLGVMLGDLNPEILTIAVGRQPTQFLTKPESSIHTQTSRSPFPNDFCMSAS